MFLAVVAGVPGLLVSTEAAAFESGIVQCDWSITTDDQNCDWSNWAKTGDNQNGKLSIALNPTTAGDHPSINNIRQQSVVIGYGSYAHIERSTVLGYNSLADNWTKTGSAGAITVVGSESKGRGDQAVVVGNTSGAAAQGVALGANVFARGESSIAIGNDDLIGSSDYKASPYAVKLPVETLRTLFSGLYDKNSDKKGWFFDNEDEFNHLYNRTDDTGKDYRIFSPTYAAKRGAIAIGSRAVAGGELSTSLGSLSFALADHTTAVGIRSYVAGVMLSDKILREYNWMLQQPKDSSVASSYARNIDRPWSNLTKEEQDVFGTENSFKLLKSVVTYEEAQKATIAAATGKSVSEITSGYKQSPLRTGAIGGTAMGENSYVFAPNSVAVGNEVEASKQGSFAYGYNAKASGEGSMALGYGTAAAARLNTTKEKVLGDKSFYEDMNAKLKALHESTKLFNPDGTLNTDADKNFQTFLKKAVTDLETRLNNDTLYEKEEITYLTTDKSEVRATAQNSDPEVQTSDHLAQNAVAIGRYAFALKNNSLALGYLAISDGSSSLAIGSQTHATDKSSGGLALGVNAYVDGKNSSALGYASSVFAANATALGVGSRIEKDGSNSIALGVGSSASGSNSFVGGFSAHTYANNSIVIGENAKAGGFVDETTKNKLVNDQSYQVVSKEEAESDKFNQQYPILIDLKTGQYQYLARNSTSIGKSSEATGFNSMALGNNSKANLNNSVALGVESVTDYTQQEYSTSGWMPDGEDSLYQLTSSTTGVISVGQKSSERRIVNVSGGASDTDAVNVAQLKSVYYDMFAALGNLSKESQTHYLSVSKSGLNKTLETEMDKKEAYENYVFRKSQYLTYVAREKLKGENFNDASMEKIKQDILSKESANPEFKTAASELEKLYQNNFSGITDFDSALKAITTAKTTDTETGKTQIGNDVSQDVVDASNYNNNTAIAADSIAIGYAATTKVGNEEGSGGIAIGAKAQVSGVGAISIGSSVDGTLTDEEKELNGKSNTVTGDASIGIGLANNVSGKRSIAVGTGNIVRAKNSGVFGDPSVINYSNSYAVGNNNTIGTESAADDTKLGSFVFGNNVNVTADQVFVLGNGTSTKKLAADTARSVYLGDNTAAITKGDVSAGKTDEYASFVFDKDGSDSTTTDRTTFSGFAGTTPIGVVTMGNATETRRLQGVAAGLISATSTDAINGSQLYSVINTGLNFAAQSGQTTTHGVAQLGSTVTVRGYNTASGATNTWKADSVSYDTSNLNTYYNRDANGDTQIMVGMKQNAAFKSLIIRDSADTTGRTLGSTSGVNNFGVELKATSSASLSIYSAATGSTSELAVLNVASGSLDSSSTQAVTGKQINTALSSVATILGANSTFKPDSGVVNVGATTGLGGTGYKTVDGALRAVQEIVAVSGKGLKVTPTTASTENGGQTTYTLALNTTELADDPNLAAKFVKVDGSNLPSFMEVPAATGSNADAIKAAQDNNKIWNTWRTKLGIGDGVNWFNVNSTDDTSDSADNYDKNSSGALGTDSIAIGKKVTANGAGTIAIGRNISSASVVTGTDSTDAILIGTNAGKAQTIQQGSIAVGRDTTSSNTASIAIGSSYSVTLNEKTTKYDGAKAAGGMSVALGTASVAEVARSIALGFNAKVNLGSSFGSIALGAGSETAAANTGSYLIAGVTDNAAGKTASSVLSIGSATINRQIQHVAAGVLSATSTDAINGSQLYYTNQYLLDLANKVGNGPINGVDGVAGQDGTTIAGTHGATGAQGSQGIPGKDGTAGLTGPAGRDGQNNTTIVNKVQSLRDGVAGTVVYTDQDGNRVLVENGKYYDASLVEGKAKHTDGLWYDIAPFNADGSLKDEAKGTGVSLAESVLTEDGKTYNAKITQGKKKATDGKWYDENKVEQNGSLKDPEDVSGQTLAQLEGGEHKDVVFNSDKIVLSAVNPDGKTATPVRLANLISALNFDPATYVNAPITTEAAKAKIGVPAQSDQTATGLFAMKGAELNRAVTAADLQALALVGMNFAGRSGDSLTVPLGGTFNIWGDGAGEADKNGSPTDKYITTKMTDKGLNISLTEDAITKLESSDNAAKSTQTISLSANTGATKEQTLGQKDAIAFGVKGDNKTIETTVGNDSTDVTIKVKDSGIGTVQLADTAVTKAKLASGVQTSLANADTVAANTFTLKGDKNSATDAQQLNKTGGLEFTIAGGDDITTKADGSSVTLSLNKATTVSKADGEKDKVVTSGAVADAISGAKTTVALAEGEAALQLTQSNSTTANEYTLSLKKDGVVTLLGDTFAKADASNIKDTANVAKWKEALGLNGIASNTSFINFKGNGTGSADAKVTLDQTLDITGTDIIATTTAAETKDGAVTTPAKLALALSQDIKDKLAKIDSSKNYVTTDATLQLTADKSTGTSAQNLGGAVKFGIVGGAGIETEASSANNSVTIKIKDKGVTTAMLADGAVTTAQLGDGAVTGAKIAGGTITNSNIADKTITKDKLNFSIDNALTVAEATIELQGNTKDGENAASTTGKKNLKDSPIFKIAGSTAAGDGDIKAIADTNGITLSLNKILASSGITDTATGVVSGQAVYQAINAARPTIRAATTADAGANAAAWGMTTDADNIIKITGTKGTTGIKGDTWGVVLTKQMIVDALGNTYLTSANGGGITFVDDHHTTENVQRTATIQNTTYDVYKKNDVIYYAKYDFNNNTATLYKKEENGSLTNNPITIVDNSITDQSSAREYLSDSQGYAKEMTTAMGAADNKEKTIQLGQKLKFAGNGYITVEYADTNDGETPVLNIKTTQAVEDALRAISEGNFSGTAISYKANGLSGSKPSVTAEVGFDFRGETNLAGSTDNKNIDVSVTDQAGVVNFSLKDQLQNIKSIGSGSRETSDDNTEARLTFNSAKPAVGTPADGENYQPAQAANISANNVKLTGLADGKVETGSKDAITGGQLAKILGINSSEHGGLGDRITALENGLKGTVVYTDANGVRLAKASDGKFYVASEVEEKVLIDDQWYKIADLKIKEDGSYDTSNAAAQDAPTTAAIDNPILSLVDGSSATNKPITLANLASALGIVTTGTTSATDDYELGGNPITKDTAQTVIGKMAAGGEAATGLYKKQGAELTRAATLADLQALAVAGIDILGNQDDGENKVNRIRKALGSVLSIEGKKDAKYVVANDDKDTSKLYSADNLITHNDGGVLRIEMLKAPSFEALNLQTAGEPTVKLTTGGTAAAPTLNLAGGTDTAQNVEIKGVADGTTANSAVNKGQLDKVANLIGTPGTPGANGAQGPAGKDGTNGQSLFNQVDALRNGLSGTVVYTDKDGKRLISGAGNYYYRDVITDGYKKANDGKWYAEGNVNSDGTVKAKDPMTNAAPVGVDLATLNANYMRDHGGNEADQSVAATNVILSTVDAAGNTATPIKLANLVGALGAELKATSTAEGAPQKTTDAPSSKDADTIVANLLKGKAGKTANSTDPLDMSRVATAADLEILAKAGLTFQGNDDKDVQRALSETLTIKGDGTTHASFGDSAKGNIDVVADTTENPTGLVIKLAKTLTNIDSIGTGKADTKNAAYITFTAGKDAVEGVGDGQGTPAVAPSISMNNALVTGVAKGSVTSTSKDAINGSQLYDYMTNVNNVLGSSVTQGADGKLTGANIGGTGKDTIEEAIAAINTSAGTASSGFNIAGNSTAKTGDPAVETKGTVKPNETLTITGAENSGITTVANKATDTITIDVTDNAKFGSHVGVDKITNANGTSLVQEKAVKSYVDDLAAKIGVGPANGIDGAAGTNGQPGTSSSSDTKGIPGQDGATGPAGNDGLNGTTVGNKVQALRDGAAGTVVYTDKSGNRVLVENGHYYKTNTVEGYEKANDGLWYKKEAVNADGTVDQTVLDGLTGADKKGQSLATLATSKTGAEIQPAEVMLSAVNADGSTKAPSALANVLSALGLKGTADNKAATADTTTYPGDTAEKAAARALAAPAAISEAAAKKVIAGKNDGTIDQSGKSGLYALSGAQLNKATTLGDLQAVAQAGLDFTGSIDSSADSKGLTVHRPLGTALNLIGAKDSTAGLEDKDKYDAKNLATFVDVSSNQIQFVMKKSPTFEGLTLQTKDKPAVKFVTGGTTDKPELTLSGANGNDTELKGIAAGTAKNSAVNKGQLDELAKKIGVATDGTNGINGVDGAAGENGQPGTPISSDTKGIPGKDGRTGPQGPAGKDGLNGTTTVNKVQALRDGAAGTVVYTDVNGNRLLVENGKYYNTALADGLEKANDGLWYAKDKVNADGTLAADAGVGKSLAALNEEKPATQKQDVAAKDVILSAVNANGDTKTKTTLANIKNHLEPADVKPTSAQLVAAYNDGKAEADQVTNELELKEKLGTDNAYDAFVAKVKRTLEDAQARKLVAGDALDGKGGLYAKSGAELSHAVSLGDLQTVAQAGLTFVGNDGVNIHRVLGTALTIIGKSGAVYGSSGYEANKYSADNLITHNSADGTLSIEMKKTPTFEGVKLNNGEEGATTTTIKSTKDGDVNLSKDDKTGDAGKVVLSGLKDGIDPDTAVTKGALDKLANQIGVPTNGTDGQNGINGVDGFNGTNGADATVTNNDGKGVPGRNGAEGPAGKDGLNGTTIVNKIQGLRDGVAGTVIYTDTDGNRLLVENGKYYKPELVKDMEKANDGLWYAKDKVNADGTVAAGAENTGKSLAALNEAKPANQKKDVAADEVMLSAVDPNGNTQKPTTLANIKSNIVPETVTVTDEQAQQQAVDNYNALQTNDEDKVNSYAALEAKIGQADAKALADAAKTELVAKAKADAILKAVAGENKDGKGGLYAKSGADLNKAATVGDLQTVAQAGLTFVGNDGVLIHRPLGTALNIIGKAGASYDATVYSADNIITRNSADGTLSIEMKKTPTFEGVKLNNGEDDSSTVTMGTDGKGNVSFGNDSQNGADGKVVLSGLKDGDAADTAVTKGALDKLKDQLGIPKDGTNGTNGINGIDGFNGTNGADATVTNNDGKGVPGRNGAEGPAGKDGLNGTTINNKVQGLRDGVAGTVVYTDKDGNRLIAENGKYYKTDLVNGLEKANDGLWYKTEWVNADGSVKNEGKDKGQSLKALNDAVIQTAKDNATGDAAAVEQAGQAADTSVKPEDIALSAVNANGETTTPTVLTNIADGVKANDAVNKSQLDAVESKADAATAAANAGFTLNTGTQEVVNGKVVVKETDNVGQVKPNTTVVVVDGKNTKVSKVKSDSADVISYTIEVNGIPMSYVNSKGDTLVKVGDKFVALKPNGEIDPSNTDTTIAGMKVVNPNTPDNGLTVDNVAAGKVADGSKQAINGDQLNSVVKTLGSDFEVDKTTQKVKVKTPVDNTKDFGNKGGIAGTGKETISDALKEVVKKSNIEVTNGDDNIVVETTTDPDSNKTSHKVKLADHIKVKQITLGDEVNKVNMSVTADPDGKNVLNVGTEQTPTRVRGVADGVKDTDAVNVGQMNRMAANTAKEITKVNKRVDALTRESRAGIAGAMAAAGLQQTTQPGRTTISVGTATFKGESAVALGISKLSDNGKVGIRISGMTTSNGDTGGTVSVGYTW